MGKLIQDEFTSLRVSRQRRYQLRREKAGLCRLCGLPVSASGYCAEHLEKQRMLCRKIKTPSLDPRDLI